jgi:putative flippase GtrA
MRRLQPALAGQFLKYGLASALALAVDWALMVGLTEFAGLPYLASATVGFAAGMVVAYTLSVRFVFSERRLRSPAAELMIFALVGLAALALNHVLLLVLVERFGMHYAAAKAPVAVACFLLNFTLRKALLFSSARAAPLTA